MIHSKNSTWILLCECTYGSCCSSTSKAKHIANLEHYFEYLGLKAGLKKLIIDAVDAVQLVKLEDGQIKFVNIMALKFIQNAEMCRGELDVMDMKCLKNKQDASYEIMEHTTQYFNCHSINEIAWVS